MTQRRRRRHRHRAIRIVEEKWDREKITSRQKVQKFEGRANCTVKTQRIIEV